MNAFIFAALILVGLSSAHDQCGFRVYNYIQQCSGSSQTSICDNLRAEISDNQCGSLLADALICVDDFRVACPALLETKPEAQDFRQVFRSIAECVDSHSSQFKPACQETKMMKNLVEKAARMRCGRKGSEYLLQCGQNEQDSGCPEKLAEIKTLGCEAKLNDMRLCESDVRRLCPAPEFPLPMQGQATTKLGVQQMQFHHGGDGQGGMRGGGGQMGMGGNRGDGQPPQHGGMDGSPDGQQEPPRPEMSGSNGGQIEPQQPNVMPVFDSTRGRPPMCFCIAQHLDELSEQCQNSEMAQRIRRRVNEDPNAFMWFGGNPGQPISFEPGQGNGRGWRCPFRRGHPYFVHAMGALSSFIVLVAAAVYVIHERRRRAALRLERMGGSKVYSGEWTTGLFGSWYSLMPDFRTCLPSFFLPPVQTALNQAEIEDRDVSVADICMNLYTPMRYANTYRDRQALRHQYDMPPDSCGDMLASVLCNPCAIAQVSRELDARAQLGQGHVAVTIGVPVTQQPPEVVKPLP